MGQDQKYVVKGGTRPKDTFTFNDIYVYPAFLSARVNFKNDHFGVAMMNYNRFTGEMDFIKERDTLALADQDLIKNIVIQNDIFYCQLSVGCVQRIIETSSVTLGKKDYMEMADRRRHPNSGTSGNASNGSFNNINTTSGSVAAGLTLNMIEKVDLIYRRKSDYYLINAKGLFFKADKKNVIRLFPDKQTLSSYIDEYQVDFRNGESLQNLFIAIGEMK